MKNAKTRREQIIQNIKSCGQSLINNAEQIAGDYEFLRSVSISCCVDDMSEAPTISVMHDFSPEIIIEKVKE